MRSGRRQGILIACLLLPALPRRLPVEPGQLQPLARIRAPSGLPGGVGANSALSPRSGQNPQPPPPASHGLLNYPAYEERVASSPPADSARYGLARPSTPTTSRPLNMPRPGYPSPGRGGERTRAPLEVGGAALAILNSFTERRPPFARASICFPEKQVTAGDAGPAPALYLSPVNASHHPPSPASYTLPTP